MDRNYNQMTEHPPLRTFAFIGVSDVWGRKLRYLANLAEEENWYYDNPSGRTDEFADVGVLHQYIMHTFSKSEEESLILMDEEHAIFNTGLLSKHGEEIFMLFTRNERDEPKWYHKSFYVASAHEIPIKFRDKLPEYVDYFKNEPSSLYFDTSLPINGSVSHIIDDNMDRLPASLQQLPKELVSDVVNSVANNMKKRISRNNRLVVPQYYNKRIMYLAPLKFGNDYIALALERHGDSYRINTVLTPGMAYCNARLIMKPESNWLVNE